MSAHPAMTPAVGDSATYSVIAQGAAPGRGRVARLSATLSWYVVRRVGAGVALTLICFAAVALVVDLVEHLKRTGADAIGLQAALEMALLRLPRLVERLLPFAILLGTALSLRRLERTAELVIARASGASPHQLTAPLLAAMLATGIAALALLDPLAAACASRYEQMSQEQTHRDAKLFALSSSNVWLQEETEDRTAIIRARSIETDPITLHDVSVLTLDAAFQPVGRVVAERARLEPGRWVLEGAAVLTGSGVRPSSEPILVPSRLDADAFAADTRDPDTLTIRGLASYAHLLDAVGLGAREHRLTLLQRTALPIALCAMLLAGIALHLGLHRRSAAILAGAALCAGLAFYVTSDVLGALATAGHLPEPLAAFVVPLAAASLGLGALFWIEES